ncbi:permease [Psychromonas sp. RZ22]|uniref:permease n=1 Tax=Psychromonas algarum TaxID=2555643 RepID=UPI0010689769|nr:permease [Psychromonas sp. RZ22]TEW53997.1 permease [Psychromonas sp. RZ22]
MLLTLSILALFLGPVTYRLLQRQPGWIDLLDAFIFVSISGLVLFHILPELLHEGGLLVLVLTGLGLLMPSVVEKYFHKAASKAHNTTLLLGVLGLVIHASIDGTVLLADHTNQTEWLLALGVLLHRFPVGLTIWWLLRPQYGIALPFVVLISMAAATLLGASYAELSVAQLDGPMLAWFQAFVMGSIMHVVLHRPYIHQHKKHQAKEAKEHKYAAGVGSFLGLVVLGFVLLPHWLGYVQHNHGHHHSASAHNHHEIHSHDGEHQHSDHDDAYQHSAHETHDDEHLHSAHEVHDHDEHQHGTHEAHDDEHLHSAHEVHDHDEEHQHSAHETHNDEHQHSAHEAHEHEEQQHNTALTLVNFTKLALFSAPMLLLAYLLSGLMHYFKPALDVLPEQGNKGYFKDAIKGVIYGLPLPICSPVASKMHQKLLGLGANQTFATAFLIATPIIGFDAILISIPLLGEQLVLLRIAFAVIFAGVIAWLLGRHFKKPISEVVVHPCQGGKPTSRFITAIKQGYQHQLDHTAPWVIFGWAIAATLSATPAWAFFEQALWLQVLVMIVIAFPFALCATGMTPIIAVMLIAGLSPGAAIACLLIGPSISLDLLKQLRHQQGYFAALAFAMLMLLGAFLIGLSLNQYIDTFSLPWLGESEPSFYWWQYLSLGIILVLYFASLLRRGARAFIAELLPKSLLGHHHHH